MVLDRYSHEKDKHSMLRVACVYLREVTNMISIILRLNVSRLSSVNSCSRLGAHTLQWRLWTWPKR